MENTSNPFHNLEQILSSHSLLKNWRKRYITDIIENVSGEIESIDQEKGIIKFDKYYNGKNTIEQTFSFNDYLFIELLKGFEIIKHFIDKGFVENLHSKDKYLEFLAEQFIYLSKLSSDYQKDFPSLLIFLNQISKYINEKYASGKDYLPVIEIFEEEINLEITCEGGNILQSILGFLDGTTDDGKEIMCHTQYEQMIIEFNNFFDDEDNYNPSTIISHINVSRALLFFSLWVLHKHIYESSGRNNKYLTLINNLFADFADWSENTIYRKFGNSGDVRYRDLKFIPAIIKTELEAKERRSKI